MTEDDKHTKEGSIEKPQEAPEQRANQELRRIDEGYSLELEMKRGSGTRDQDKVKGKIKTETLEELKEQRVAMLNEMKKTIKTAREIQPEAEK